MDEKWRLSLWAAAAAKDMEFAATQRSSILPLAKCFRLSKRFPIAREYGIIEAGGEEMESWRKDSRREPVITDLDALVPKDHLLRKIEKIMDYDWLYERLGPYYCHDNGRPGTDPVVLIKMVLIQHLYGIPSLRQTYQRIQDTLS